MYKHLSALWKAPKKTLGNSLKVRLVGWRKENVVSRIEKPTRLDRARALGYKAKQGVIVVRVRVNKGKRKTPKVTGGRVPKKSGRFFPAGKSKRVRAEKPEVIIHVIGLLLLNEVFASTCETILLGNWFASLRKAALKSCTTKRRWIM